MLTADGVVVAMDDAAIVWKPRDGKQRRVRLEARASVLLGLVGPLGSVDKIVVGDVYGGINFISLSTMEVVDRYVTTNDENSTIFTSY